MTDANELRAAARALKDELASMGFLDPEWNGSDADCEKLARAALIASREAAVKPLGDDAGLDILRAKIREAERFDAVPTSEWCFPLSEIREFADRLETLTRENESLRSELDKAISTVTPRVQHD